MHPFYDITQQSFVDAEYLKAGDQLQIPVGRAVVTGIRLYHADTTSYDITIGNLHTYYVVAGDTPVLVHNIACSVGGPAVEYGAPDSNGRVTGVATVLTKDVVGGSTDPQVDPAGWVKNMGYNRAHLLGAQLGGSNTDAENFVTMYAYANSPVMRGIENTVAASVKAGETIQYEVNPIYEDGNPSPLPVGVYVRAVWNQGTDIEIFIMNQPKSAFGLL